MSAFEALRHLPFSRPERKAAPTLRPPNPLEEMQTLVRLASTPGVLERESPTWTAVCHWAANELLQTCAQQESADDARAGALRVRARVLRELLALGPQKSRPRFEPDPPHIP